jgi:UV DNA damage endonuclease
MYIPSNFNLGYACINNTLREKGIFMSRTLRLNTILNLGKEKGVQYAKNLALENLKDLFSILKWNKENDISFMRLSSEIFPFASHIDYGYNLDFCDIQLKEIGKYAKENNIRLCMHPAQFNVLSSPNENIIQNSFRDLDHHCDILDRMDQGKDSVIIIHGGGVYNDKKSSLKRLKENISRLPISEELSIPIVIDTHHNSIYSSSQPVEFYFNRVFKVWFDRGIKPKVHVSNSMSGVKETDNKSMRRKHSNYIHFIHKPLYLIKFPIDIMLECKMKEKALLRLRNNKNNFKNLFQKI